MVHTVSKDCSLSLILGYVDVLFTAVLFSYQRWLYSRRRG